MITEFDMSVGVNAMVKNCCCVDGCQNEVETHRVADAAGSALLLRLLAIPKETNSPVVKPSTPFMYDSESLNIFSISSIEVSLSETKSNQQENHTNQLALSGLVGHCA